MKFKAKPVNDLTDVTLDLEQLETRDILDQSSTTILQLLATGSKRQIAFGNDTVTFTASTSSAGKTVTHNLGRVPLFVCGFNNAANAIWMSADSLTTTQVRFFGSFTSAISGTFTFLWVAIG